ncbi:MAG: mercuric reductase [Acidobacteriota bacterium]
MNRADPANQRLLASVHPPAWQNPLPAGRYNLVVIGGGTAGLVCAAGAAGLGANVALVERHLLGGDCLNVGCVPSKALLHAARADAGDFTAAMARVRAVRAAIAPHDSAERFRGLGVDVYFGHARFRSPRQVEVAGQVLTFARAVIATGGRPAVPDIPGLADAAPLTNESVFELERRPARLAIVGGGPIGCELAEAFARLGSEVSLIEAAPNLLPREDADVGGVVGAALARRGVRVATGVSLASVRLEGAERVLTLSNGATIAADQLLVAVGRRPNIEDLDLDRADVRVDERRGLVVDDRLRTTNPAVYGCGDVCLDWKFTHAADAAARIVIQNALFAGRRKASALTIPWATYTIPEVGRVGLSRAEADARNVAVDVYERPLSRLDRAVTDDAADGFVRVLTSRGSDRVLGATIVAPRAGDMVGEMAVVMAARMGLGRLASVVHPYPTYAEALRQLGDDYNRTRLTPLVRRLMSAWLAWGRR